MEIVDVNGWKVAWYENKSPVMDIRFSVLAGSEKETPATYGVAHFVEHLLFKGTAKRDFLQIADDIARIGGHANAFTDVSIVSYYMKVMKQYFESGFEILSDMYFNSTFPNEEMEKERNVILEEAKGYLDNPDYFCYEEGRESFDPAPRSHRIIGTLDTISAITRDDIVAYVDGHYRGGNVLVSVVGGLSQAEMEDVVGRYLPPALSRDGRDLFRIPQAAFNYDPILLQREQLQQSYFNLFFGGPGYQDPMFGPFRVMLNALGSGMHSLLFKVVREKLGLCYSIYASAQDFVDYSAGIISTGLSKENIDTAREAIQTVIDGIRKDGIDPDLLEMTRATMITGKGMAVETSSGYANAYVLNHLRGKEETYDEFVESVNSVTNEQIVEAANATLSRFKEATLTPA